MRFLEKDIRPEKIMQGAEVSLKNDIKLLLKSKKLFVKVSCPACQSKKKKIFFKKRGIQVFNMHQLFNILYESKADCKSFGTFL